MGFMLADHVRDLQRASHVRRDSGDARISSTKHAHQATMSCVKTSFTNTFPVVIDGDSASGRTPRWRCLESELTRLLWLDAVSKKYDESTSAMAL